MRLEPQILLIQVQHVIWGEVGLEGRRPGQHVLHFLTMSEGVDARGASRGPAEEGGASSTASGFCNQTFGFHKLAVSVIFEVLLARVQGVELRLPSCLVVPRIC